MEQAYIGLDIGSTTIKAVVTNEENEVVFARYERHSARIHEKVILFLNAMAKQLGTDVEARITITGSIGMGVAERYGIDFIQEVVSAAGYMHEQHPEIHTMIDIGGEDAKIVFFKEGQAPDLRMNGNCAGGTGAFIDQMASLLNVTPEELSNLAVEAERVYPIASRCGVFCKTDIQNLLAKNADIQDIAASIFHAVAVQTVVTLSHGQDIEPPILLCGGPLTFLPSLRKAFEQYLHLEAGGLVLPEKSQLIPAWGAAINSRHLKSKGETILALKHRIESQYTVTYKGSKNLKPLFRSKEELAQWQEQKLRYRMPIAELEARHYDVTMGIDSGSTTTKIIILDEQGQLLYHYYQSNNGDPIGTVRRGLEAFDKQCKDVGADVKVKGSVSTGYGEDLIKAAFNLNGGIIETIAHFLAARQMNPKVSFILDIGGQDMKAIFVENGVINHIEINEACSSGCGTFIETFARSMNYRVEDFAHEACMGQLPCDLGTRCTVFMNSKVKQVLREGATIGDIASGLSYSVINNCLHKVLKIKSIEQLGKHIVVQGGTIHNDSVVRALEMLTQRTVYRSDRPELMGAYGCALFALNHMEQNMSISDMLNSAQMERKQMQCHGCENNCLVARYKFENGRTFFSGNKCERIFTNRAKSDRIGRNLYTEKLSLLFDRIDQEQSPNPQLPHIGIPRVLNQFEEFPFWHALFTGCGFRVTLSDSSTFAHYERGVKSVMSDNICFPAKLVHSHILDLQEKGVDRIFFPYVIFERQQVGVNSFNCPIVSAYSDVVRNSMNLNVPLDSPTITFKDQKALYKQLSDYLKPFGVKESRIRKAFDEAIKTQQDFELRIAQLNEEAFEESQKEKRLTIVLGGRPYHSDPLIQHKLSDMVTAMGVDCLTVDIVRNKQIDISDIHFVSQWAYPEQILKAAKWTAQQDGNVQFVELTSFGCGPDAFMLDEIHTLLQRYGKSLTQLKIDDVSNIGSLKLRVRSVVDSLKLKFSDMELRKAVVPFTSTPIYTMEERLKKSKIIVPYFASFITPLIPAFMRISGYDVDVLPMSDPESSDWGLRYANNEVCYPATLIVGDFVKAFKSGQYDPDKTTALITQTGGQCRASNYISLIKKALVEAGYGQVPLCYRFR